jgi:hypothetical protein
MFCYRLKDSDVEVWLQLFCPIFWVQLIATVFSDLRNWPGANLTTSIKYTYNYNASSVIG